MNKKIKKKYFKIMQNQNDPQFFTPQKLINNQQTLASSLLKHNKYIYLDMSSTKGFKLMQNVQSDYSDDDNQNFGSNIVCDTLKFSKQKAKLKQFMTINIQNRQKNAKIRQKVKEEIQKSKQKIIKSLKTLEERPKIYLGMETKKFNRIKDQLQINEINNNILKKQQQMIQKLGIIADFQSINQKNTQSISKKLKKKQNYFLPRILKSYK